MLNPTLYSALVAKFGKNNVKVVRLDEAMQNDYQSYYDGDGTARKRLHRIASGQEFHLKCPMCRDHKTRLSISYKWGLMDETSGTRNLWLIQCWNESCFSEYTVRRKFYDDLMSGDFQIIAEAPAEAVATYREPTSPGKLWRIDRLAAKSPKHPAVMYCQRRLMDIELLGAQYTVGFSPQPTSWGSKNRLIAPVIFDGKFSGWTARYLGDAKQDSVPKWLHDPGMRKSQVLYGYDQARDKPLIKLVEGPGDVWGVRTGGMGLLGKTISTEQLKILQALDRADLRIAIMLDPEQSKTDVGKVHHIQQAYDRLKDFRDWSKKVFKVWLPIGLDPNETDVALQNRLIAEAARAQKVSIPDFL